MVRARILAPQAERTKPNAARPGGKTRARSDAARQAILAAALALLDEKGFSLLTIEAVAARSGTGKTTIYRHWPTLATLVLDAYVQTGTRHVPVPDEGNVRADLVQFMTQTCRALGGTNAGMTMAALMAEAQNDPDLAERLRERWIAVRRAALGLILERGQERGELRAELDREVVIDMLYGPMWYRLLNGHGPLDDAFVQRLVEQLLRGTQAGES